MNRVGTVVRSTTLVVRCCDTDDESFFYCPECAQLGWLQRFIDERRP